MALWGGRFSGETRSEVAKFTESISFDKRLYKHDIQGSCAHVKMLAHQGIIPLTALTRQLIILLCVTVMKSVTFFLV